MVLITVIALVVLAALVPVVVTWIERRQARAQESLEPYVGPPHAEAGAAVIYFSRSGSTALAARHVANRLRARLIEIVAPQYELGLAGWVNALRDARDHDAVITPRTVDLTKHDPIYLGSPIWLYSPAPPLWEFMENSDFTGKRVILFNTFNSTFEPEYIERFRQGVLDRGARSFEHRSVRRGRMGQQLSPQEMLDRIDAEWNLGNDG